MAFKVGQKVCCIENVAWYGDGIGPQKGDVLVIRDIRPDRDGTYLLFPEWDGNQRFLSKYFRPLQETGMSILYGLLKTKSEKELVE